MPPTRPITHTLRALSRAPHHAYSTTPSPAPKSASHSSSVDPAEIQHFNALASSWWDPHGPSRLLHLMNPSRHAFLASCIQSTNQLPIRGKEAERGLDVLDVGCGGGIFAESAARLPWVKSVTGVDPSEGVLEVAREHMRQDPTLSPLPSSPLSTIPTRKRLEYIQTTINDLATHPHRVHAGYDILTLFEVLEHVPSPSTFLKTCLPLVKPGGWIVGSTISRTWASWLITNVVAEDIMRLVPRGTHDWHKYINETELRDWFAKQTSWGNFRSVGIVYIPGLGWTEVQGGEGVGNYYFGVRKLTGQ
jgi:polyprenyldihydroxybenzoate methyltransferase / 3-demethylubiquinol 3-O-methyltransferase